MDSIEVSTVVSLRDRALIGLMAFRLRASARPSPCALRTITGKADAGGWPHEKLGKRHEMPAHHNLGAYLDAYLERGKIREAKKSPLFRSARGRTGGLTERPMNRIDAWRIVQRRAADLGMRVRVGCHAFRAT